MVNSGSTSIQISKRVFIPENEIQITAMRSQGAGGQHVNKVSTAIQLRFDIKKSSLPGLYKDRLLKLNDKRITREGVLIIKSQLHRSQWQNRKNALNRMVEIIKSVLITERKRIPTQPTKVSQIKRLEDKSRRGRTKALRRNIKDED